MDDHLQSTVIWLEAIDPRKVLLALILPLICLHPLISHEKALEDNQGEFYNAYIKIVVVVD